MEDVTKNRPEGLLPTNRLVEFAGKSRIFFRFLLPVAFCGAGEKPCTFGRTMTADRAFSAQGRGSGGKKKSLWKNQSFPHSPQVFPQGFSTVPQLCGKFWKDYITLFPKKPSSRSFPRNRHFAQREIFVKNVGVDKSKIKFFKKGLILSLLSVIILDCMKYWCEEV